MKKVLIVDDSLYMRTLINSALIAFVMKSPAKNIKSHSLRVEKEDGVSILFQKHFVRCAVQF